MENQGFDDDGILPKVSTQSSGQRSTPEVGLAVWRDLLQDFVTTHKKKVNVTTLVVGLIVYHAYFFWCLYRHINKEIPIFGCSDSEFLQSSCGQWNPAFSPPRPYWCDSVAFLIIITALAWVAVLYSYMVKPLFGPSIETLISKPLSTVIDRFLSWRFSNIILYALVLVVIGIFLVIDTKDSPERLIGVAGFFVLVLIGWLFSVYPSRVRWRHIFWGHSLQFFFALIVLRWNVGKQIIQCLSSKVSTFLNYTYAGTAFVFGYLSDGTQIFMPENYRKNENTTEVQEFRQILSNMNSDGVVGTPFYFGALSIIYFVSFFVSMLFYWGTLQFIVQKLGWLLYVTVGTTAAESMNAAANIFLGQTEAPLLIRPYLPTMTKSEINAVMTGGFATIAGTILGGYIAMGIDPGHLITCSFMAAPCALAVSKLFYPETEESQTTIENIVVEKGDESNVLDAAAKGASTAIMLVLNIGASLLAFTAFITFLDEAINWFGTFAGWEELTFTYLLGYVMYPVAFLIGIKPEDCQVIGELIGKKLLITEFPAFRDLYAAYEGQTIQPRSFAIATYALCGFANFPSLGIQIGGFGAMAPERKSEIAQIALRAMLGGAWVSFLNACIAGVLLDTV